MRVGSLGFVIQTKDVCVNQAKAGEDCLRVNLDDIGKCQFYNECRRRRQSSTTSSEWSLSSSFLLRVLNERVFPHEAGI